VKKHLRASLVDGASTLDVINMAK